MRTIEEIKRQLVKERFRQVLVEMNDGTIDKEARRILENEKLEETLAAGLERFSYWKRLGLLWQRRLSCRNVCEEVAIYDGEAITGLRVFAYILVCNLIALRCFCITGGTDVFAIVLFVLAGTACFHAFSYMVSVANAECKKWGKRMLIASCALLVLFVAGLGDVYFFSFGHAVFYMLLGILLLLIGALLHFPFAAWEFFYYNKYVKKRGVKVEEENYWNFWE